MNDDRDIDLASFRRSRWDTIRDRLTDMIPGLRQRHWMIVDAEIRACTSSTQIGTSRGPIESLKVGPYIVDFTYKVNGRIFDGVTSSPVKVEKHDKFAIHYNPRRPEENNSLDSETAWVNSYAIVSSVVILLMILFGFLRNLFFPS